MRSHSSDWISRLAAIAILILLLCGVFFFLGVPLIEAYRSVDEEKKSAQEMLSRYEVISATHKPYSAQLAELEARQTYTGVYLDGATDTVASAKLQEHIRSVVSSNGGQLDSIQTLPSQTDGDHLRVSVRLRFKASLESLYRILYSIESLRPFAFVDSFDIRTGGSIRRKALEEIDPVLIIRVDIFGFVRPNETS